MGAMNAKQIEAANKRAQNDAEAVKAAAVTTALYIRDKFVPAKDGAKHGAKVAIAYATGFLGTFFSRAKGE